MYDVVRNVNGFFRGAEMDDILDLRKRLSMTERQKEIFDMYYLHGMDLGYVSDRLNVSQRTVGRELATLRQKMEPLVEE